MISNFRIFYTKTIFLPFVVLVFLKWKLLQLEIQKNKYIFQFLYQWNRSLSRQDYRFKILLCVYCLDLALSLASFRVLSPMQIPITYLNFR